MTNKLWKDCKKELPPSKDKKYFVHYKYYNGLSDYGIAYYCDNGEFDVVGYGYMDNGSVLHWMEIPSLDAKEYNPIDNKNIDKDVEDYDHDALGYIKEN